MEFLKQSTAGTICLGPFLSNDSGTGLLTNLTIVPSDVYLSKNGAAFAVKNDSGTANHGTQAFYHIGLNTTDTDTIGRLIVSIHKGTALDVWDKFMVVPSSIYDWFFGSDKLDVGTADNILANAAKTGYSLAADQSAVSIGSCGNLLANADKTGYSLAADQSGVSVGTANAVVSIPNPTGGTIDLAAAVTNLSFDGTRVACNLEAVEGAGSCDTIDWETAFKRLLSYVSGQINKSGNDYAYRNQANDTTLMTLTSSTGSRTVA